MLDRLVRAAFKANAVALYAVEAPKAKSHREDLSPYLTGNSSFLGWIEMRVDSLGANQISIL